MNAINRPSLPHFINALNNPELDHRERSAAGREVLKRFIDYQFRQYDDGAPVANLIKERATFVDQLLKKIWKSFICNERAVLIAVGGYGRGELHPYSDIDLLILCEEPDHNQEPISAFITFLWDIGFDVGHSIRSVEECIEEGSQDVTIATNLLEARWITGDYTRYQALQEIWRHKNFWGNKAFFQAKYEEQLARHKRFNDTIYQLEPNIKESPGGLRDIQMIYWVAKRKFQAKSINELVQRNFLTTEEFLEIEAASKYLNRIRFALQHLKKRREDRLLFEHQQSIAESFGYEDNPDKMAVEQFMSGYYRNVQNVVKLNEILLQHFREEFFEEHLPVMKPINSRFYLINGYLDIVHPQVFSDNPTALLEVFIVLESLQEVQGLRSNAIRSIRDHLHLINDEFRRDPINKALFMEIFRQPKGINAAVKRMHGYGILGAYLPVFKKISGLMQFNIFHAYTVDDHTILVIRNLRRFFVDEFSYEFPTAHQIAKTICRPELLFLAGLFHDIAKGRKGAHEILGAEDALEFAQNHNLSKKDAELISWLVRYHLEFSHVAQKKDLSDPKVINQFAELMQDQEHLDYLYLLTVGDVCATSNDVWNDWKNSLFLELYNETSNRLAQQSDAPKSKAKKALQTQEKAKEILTKKTLGADSYQKLWDSLSASEFFSRQSSADVARITEKLYRLDKHETHIFVRSQSIRGASELMIYMPDRDYLFAYIANALDHLGLDVMEARIFSTNDGMTLVLMYFLEREAHQRIDSQAEITVAETIRNQLNQDTLLPVMSSARLNRRMRCFETPTEIIFNHLTEKRSELVLNTKDVPGLLARIGQALMECNIRLHDAKIMTVGEKAEDVFVISDIHGMAIDDDAEIKQTLTQTLLESIEN
ncbi:[protein-PII] uridylyltransferase [Thiomicrorhabdus sp.]|uniref:[protein-PII] uridylyltransferase n=1 Tax=Thiomicrorhabdus sp. TaxID=2039724 RepID=UPI0029C951A4|nr:[protein-PII] uridylyltransferase [Thiomicrorhabdus sp.]